MTRSEAFALGAAGGLSVVAVLGVVVVAITKLIDQVERWMDAHG